MWYSGAISGAIELAKSKKSPLMIFVRQSGDAKSDTVEGLLNDADIRKLCTDNAVVALNLEFESDSGKQFAQIYPVVCVPILFLIGTDGKPLEIVPGLTERESLINQISSAIEMHYHQVDENGWKERERRMGRGGGPGPASPTRKDTPAPANFLASHQRPAPSSTGSGTSASPRDALSLDQKLDRAQELLEERRIEKEQQEAEEEKARELKRRQEGQAMLKLEQRKQDMEMEELAKERKKKKEGDKEALRRIKEQIAQDRADKNARYNKEAEDAKTEKEEERRQKELQRQEELRELEAKRSTIARIQFRLPDGSSLMEEFPADSVLGEAVEFIRQECGSMGINLGVFHLLQMYPRKEFRDEDMGETFKALQLAPTATLLVLPEKRRGMGMGGESGGIFGRVMGWVWAPFLFFYHTMMTFFGGAQNKGSIQDSQPKKRESGDGSFGRQEGGVRRMNTGRGQGQEDDDNATWNGNSTQQL